MGNMEDWIFMQHLEENIPIKLDQMVVALLKHEFKLEDYQNHSQSRCVIS